MAAKAEQLALPRYFAAPAAAPALASATLPGHPHQLPALALPPPGGLARPEHQPGLPGTDCHRAQPGLRAVPVKQSQRSRQVQGAINSCPSRRNLPKHRALGIAASLPDVKVWKIATISTAWLAQDRILTRHRYRRSTVSESVAWAC